jgi:hypothetical protein
VDGMNLYAYVKNNPLRFLDPMGTTAREKFIDSDGQSGYVSYSASGRTEDYRIDYDNSNNFYGYSSTVGNYNSSSIYNTNTNDVVDRTVLDTLSGENNNDLLLMIQASEIANTFIKSENVQNIMNDPSNRFASNDNVQVFQSYIGNQSKFTERKTIFCVCKDIDLKSLKDCFV